MAVRIKLICREGALPAVRAHAAVSLAAGVWLSGIQVVEGERGLSVVFPSSLVMDASGTPTVHEMIEFESDATRGKWQQKILAAYRAEAAPPPERKAVAPLQRIPTDAEPGPVTLVQVSGTARGNPGPGAAAALVAVPGRPPIELMRGLSDTTQSAAEHAAILMGLREVERLRATGLEIRTVLVRGDSAVAIKHLQGRWGLKDAALKAVAQECHELTAKLRLSVTFEHVEPEENRAAAALVQRCLDAGVPT